MSRPPRDRFSRFAFPKPTPDFRTIPPASKRFICSEKTTKHTFLGDSVPFPIPEGCRGLPSTKISVPGAAQNSRSERFPYLGSGQGAAAAGFWLSCSETASSERGLGDSATPFPSLKCCVQAPAPVPCSARPSPALPATELIFKTPLFLFLGGQVAKLFQDSSLGNIVNILVTRLILLTEDQVSWALLSLSRVCTSLQGLGVPPVSLPAIPPSAVWLFHILPMPPGDWAEESSGNLIFNMVR